MRKQIPLPSFSNVSAGATATVNCPVGLTYEAIILKYGGTTFDPTHMERIEVKVNGKSLWDITGSQLVTINKFYDKADNAGYLTLWFARPWMATVFESRLTALGTADVSTLSVHVKIASGAVAPELEAHAIQSGAQPLGLVAKLRQFPRSFSTTGQQEIDSLPRGGARVGAIHLFKSDVSDIEMEVNGIKVYDFDKGLAEEFQTQSGRVPQTATATHVDFLLDGDMKHALQLAGVQDWRLRPTIDTIGSVNTLVEYLDGFGGI
jgi:hypothetical protein